MKRIISIMCSVGMSIFAFAQKPVLDTSVFGKWPSVDMARLSNDGNYVEYAIDNMPVGHRTLIVKSTFTGWQRSFSDVNNAEFTADSKLAVFKDKNDSLCILNLGKNETLLIPGVSNYMLSKFRKRESLAYMLGNPSGALTLMDLHSLKKQVFNSVINFSFSPLGDILLLQTEDKKDGNSIYAMQWFDIQSGKLKTIWQGDRNPRRYVFNGLGDQLAFVARAKDGDPADNVLWRYTAGDEKAKILVDGSTPGIDSNLALSNETPEFSKDGERVFFMLIEKEIPKAKESAVKLDVWSYNDILQSVQMDLDNYLQPRLYAAVANIGKNRVIRLQREGEGVWRKNDKYVMVYSNFCDNGGVYYRAPFSPQPVYLESTRDGSRKLFLDNVSQAPGDNYYFSPGGKWLVYYDADSSEYYSYELATGIRRNISKSIAVPLVDELDNSSAWQHKYLEGGGMGLAGWLEQDQGLLIYDSYDIWQLDPADTQAPINLTHGYGRRNHTRLRLAEGIDFDHAIPHHTTLLMTSFNTDTKMDGFCRTSLDTKGDPEQLISVPEYISGWTSFNETPRVGGGMIKARDAQVWVVGRQTFNKALNWYITKDFKNYAAISDLHPEKAYNWLTAELIHWTMSDGNPGTAILYKPENFDPNKKYPIIFNYYEHLSNRLYFYLPPEPTAEDINIPYFVSRGYLVCTPDIHYQSGEPGESVVNSVVSAANYLSQMTWVDAKHMGINGHSFGGYETNYLVTHSTLFAAAAEASGLADLISGYGGNFAVFSAHFWYEAGQGRMDHTLWETPDAYIKNSPVLKADQVTTPLLMVHGKLDDLVPFGQAFEFFTGLHRLGKKAWLLEYDEDGHVIGHEKDALDMTIRTTQFFDHYLKGAPPPVWMTEGIPARLKGIKTGLDLDTSGKQP